MRQDGFSLIETMAALAILSLTGLAVLNMMQVTTRNAAAIEERSLAMLAAENLLNQEILSNREFEARSGDYELAGVRYDWTLRVDNTTDPDLLRLAMSVRSAEGEQILAELETFQRRRR